MDEHKLVYVTYTKVLSSPCLYGSKLKSRVLLCMQDVKNRVRQDFIPTFLAECLYWPFIQGFNFWKVPVKHQLLVVNTACLADSTFLSW